jgi:hypothetical protein
MTNRGFQVMKTLCAMVPLFCNLAAVSVKIVLPHKRSTVFSV